MLDRLNHHVADILRGDAAGRIDEGNGFSITVIKGECHPDPLAVVAGDLIAVRAPAGVAGLNCDAAVMAPLRSTGMARKERAERLHQAVQPLENEYVESFDDKLRNELLNGEVFKSFAEARVLIEQWRVNYNSARPHS